MRPVGCYLMLICSALAVRAGEKIVLLDDVPRQLGNFEVRPDGSWLYFAHSREYLLFDDTGRLRNRFPLFNAARELVPLADDWFLAANTHAGGHIGLHRPDGSQAKRIVERGPTEQHLRNDLTGWTTPVGLAIDETRRRFFVLDTTMAPRGKPDPDFSRIAVFDFDGQYLGDLNRYDADAPDADDARRTWYDDIEVDPVRERVYVTARRFQELWAFTYTGEPVGKAPGIRGVAVFPDGRVAVVRPDGRGIQIYDVNLQPVTFLEQAGAQDLETDASGRLYAGVEDPSITFVRWSPDLSQREVIGPRFQKLTVSVENPIVVAGEPLHLSVTVTGRPPPQAVQWQVLARPSDGRTLRWQPLSFHQREGVLVVATPPRWRGLYDVAVKVGEGPIAWAQRERDVFVVNTIGFRAATNASIAVITDTARRAFRQGEPIAVQLVRRGATGLQGEISLELTGPGLRQVVWRGAADPGTTQFPVAIRGELTRQLLPGEYQLMPHAPGCEPFALTIHIAAAEPDSPMQRILYHEFDNSPVTASQPALGDFAERLAFIRDYTDAVRRTGFTRETDRFVNRIMGEHGPHAWSRDHAPLPLTEPGLPPAEYFAIPPGWHWEAETYLDHAVRCGIVYDSQLLEHCAGVRVAPEWFTELNPRLQRAAQWMGRYASFYGFNYNDEMFFTTAHWSGWRESDTAELERVVNELFDGQPRVMAYLWLVDRMYSNFNAAVRLALPTARVTATPMWQFPAVEGSYAPRIFAQLDEVYTHYLSEGYHWPWYPPHSADMIRRPDKPLMGVFDNAYNSHDGDIYLKNAMLIAARGVQGTGTQHSRPFHEAHAASAFRVTNELLKRYGAIFAECPPANEAAVLYSFTQDITEQRMMYGTPHWCRVFELYGAGLMAGVPMAIVYEEDIAAGWLFDGKQLRVPMLFLVGQSQPLPAPVQAEIDRFVRAGGRLFTDEASREFPNASRLTLGLLEATRLGNTAFDGDGWFPLLFPGYEKLARALRASVGDTRRFPVDTDDPWVSKNFFDGGAIRYLMLATETSPYPWQHGALWSLGVLHNKTWLPRTVRLTLPPHRGVVYDVFEQRLVPLPQRVELITYPARLFALAPREVATPELSVRVTDDTIHYDVKLNVPARVPVRVRLGTIEYYRGTDARGRLSGALPRPLNAGEWQLEVSELLGGKTAAVTIPVAAPATTAWSTTREPVDLFRDDRLRILLEGAQGKITLEGNLPESQLTAVRAALSRRGLELATTQPPPEGAPRVVLAVAPVQGLSPILQAARQRGLFDVPLTAHVPGAGRGVITALLAPRAHEEHAIALVGGDAAGLEKTVSAFVNWLDGKSATPPVATQPTRTVVTKGQSLKGRAVSAGDRFALRDWTGVKLTGLRVAGDYLLVTADGYHRNVALVKDTGTSAQVVRAERIGHAATVHSAALARDGAWFAAAGRVTNRVGQVLALFRRDGAEPVVFGSFGDVGPFTYRFAISEDGNTVVAPGPYGAVCWRRDGTEWREAWSLDYWREFERLIWPVANDQERRPQFHAFIPRGADYALILFGEFTNNGWITDQAFCSGWFAAVNLSDGRERWRFEIPLLRSLIFPTLAVSGGAERALVQVQTGSWGEKRYHFFAVDNGRAVGSWQSPFAPRVIDVADVTGDVVVVYEHRLVEIRQADARLRFNQLWPAQPVSVAFTADGQRIAVADDAGQLTLLTIDGEVVWQRSLDCYNVVLASARDRVYAAGWDGRLRAYRLDGELIWVSDLTPALKLGGMSEMVATTLPADRALVAARAPTATAEVPAGPNLLRTGAATLRVYGTPGWKSSGKVQVTAKQLTNGQTNDVATPWLSVNEEFWTALAGRQVCAEITFAQPTPVQTLTVHEHADFPDSWPTLAVIQTWDEDTKAWTTVRAGLFLNGPVNTYRLDLPSVTKLRYVPLHSYFRNFYTSEIEVR